MGRVLSLWVPDWPIAVAGFPDDLPVAVVSGGAVLACSATARRAGVRRRMRQRVAQARCPQLQIIDRDLEAEVRGFEPLVRRLETEVLPHLEVIRPGLLAAPSRGPSRYWGGETQLTDRLRAATAEAGHRAEVGLADTMFAAALAARTSQNVPAGATAAFLAPYPVGVLGLPRLSELLQRLGLSTVGAFAALPADSVTARFGAPAAAAHRTARGLETRPLTVRPGGEEHVVARTFEPAEIHVERLTFAAKALADQLHEDLSAAAAVCARLEVRADLAHTGQSLSRVFRHEGRLSALAVAERIRGLVQAWADAGALGTGEDGGITRLMLRPEDLGPAAGRQQALFGEALTPLEVERAAARVQALLGHQAVTRVEIGGGRGPAEQIRRIPYGDDDTRRRLPAGPWPGQLPAPHPSTVFPLPLPATLTDVHGARVVVSARLLLPAPPSMLGVEGYGEARVTGWAGPWPVLEQWWEAGQARRIARMQVTTSDGRAWLLVIDESRWAAEGLYG
ncbi:DNA polymerase Y family protein (plasmid) [Streptomyces sp. NBC_01298]|uniref:DNA polymerase Y family protein n=1 Tax=Streptomyces sp. NBC_01298 TaxID=2903817 RepID=UPI002E110208|nr:DNA polymerase Y family protein [Streptomyces sp. NBC_01298]